MEVSLLHAYKNSTLIREAGDRKRFGTDANPYGQDLVRLGEKIRCLIEM